MHRHRIHPKVIASLHERGVTVAWLAAAAQTGRSHASQVLANVPGRGHHTRKRLVAWLTLEERLLLGWGLDGSLLFPVESSNRQKITCPSVS